MLLETVRGRGHRVCEPTTYGQKRTFVVTNVQFSLTVFFLLLLFKPNLTYRKQYGYVGWSKSHAVLRQSIEPCVVYSSRRSQEVRSLKKNHWCVGKRSSFFPSHPLSCSLSNTLLGRTGVCKKKNQQQSGKVR